MEKDKLQAMRHSASHIMAQAVLELFPAAKLGIGPAIEEGFYYDFDLPRPLTPEDLAAIERRMREVIAGKHPFLHKEVSTAEGRKIFTNQPYKLELIEALAKGEMGEHGEAQQKPVDRVSIYTHDNFTDLCRGPHVAHTGEVAAEGLKLLNIAGAYWRGDEKRPQLQRIYGTVFPSRQELDDYLERLAEAERRDHRKLGKELDLFSIHDETGAGLILWHPKGALVRHLIEDYLTQEHLDAGYQLSYTPHIGKGALWEISGHLDFFRENMYSPMDIEGQEYFVKPMNCPFHILVYKSRLRSYRELPLRISELGAVYRYERSGVLHGLLRVRGFTIDDAHIFLRPDQLEEEVISVVQFARRILGAFGFMEIKAYLATRPEKAVGEVEQWRRAEASLQHAIQQVGLEYELDEGGGAFYGPKIDLKVKDALGREWQLTTVQFDFNLPERFDLSFAGEDGVPHRPYMIHRALLGSVERFFGVLIEHYAGAFPVWLAPVQAVIIPIADRHLLYAQMVEARLKENGLRTVIDDRPERMQAKIRDAQLQKIPYMLVVGDREAEEGAVSVRLRTEEDLGKKSMEDFLTIALQAIGEKRTN
ncbi:MAG: threonine--tRNA ligase [Chloroflexi bacterium]|nr:threonine--tRNA ligase [Chloroflexota bacterium]